MYIPGVGSYDLNNDSQIDLVVYADDMPTVSGSASVKSLDELCLTEGTSGLVTLFADTERKFDSNKDYLYPVPTEDRVLTQGVITQNPGWNDGLQFN
jgi:hypothetical protein